MNIYEKLVTEDSLTVVIDLSDTFWYSTADAEPIYIYNLNKIIPLYNLYGKTAFIAYTAVKRGFDPEISHYLTEDFYVCKKVIEEIKKEDELFDFLND